MPASTGVLRHSRSDAVLVALSFAHAALLVAVPSGPLIALGLWWNANTISHNFVHLPFFRSPVLNRMYALYLTALLSIPHSIWRERHLRHHSGRDRLISLDPGGVCRDGLIAALWAGLASLDSHFFVAVYLPGYLVGLGLCHIQGHFEHARGTTSHYGRLYNFLFFNDGYHVEHHQRSSEHWTPLPRHSRLDARHSRWPPVLRWLDSISLEVARVSRAALDPAPALRCRLSRACVSQASGRAAGHSACHDRRRWFVPANRAGPTEGVARGIVDDCRCQRRQPRRSRAISQRGDRPPPSNRTACFRRHRPTKWTNPISWSFRWPLSVTAICSIASPLRPHARPRLDMEAESTRRNSVVVPAQAIEPRHPVRAVCLFVVLVIAKTLTLAGRDLPLSPLAPFVFFWQDVLCGVGLSGCRYVPAASRVRLAAVWRRRCATWPSTCRSPWFSGRL